MRRHQAFALPPVSTRVNPGFNLGSTWVQAGFKLGSSWVQAGCKVLNWRLRPPTSTTSLAIVLTSPSLKKPDPSPSPPPSSDDFAASGVFDNTSGQGRVLAIFLA